MTDDRPAALGALRVDKGKLKNHVDEIVRSSVEETLNGLLDAEADQICRAQRYERSPERAHSRAGHYKRKLETRPARYLLIGELAGAGEVDGHDFGTGQASVFIHTDAPHSTFSTLQPVLASKNLLANTRAAYRAFQR
jgi:hypothetical protein